MDVSRGVSRCLGEKIGKGMKLQAALEEMNGVVEGVATTHSVMQVAEQHDVEMPITQGVYEVIFQDKSPQQAIRELMTRQPKDEF